MKVHHLNCATMCPLGGPLLSGSLTRAARVICHCLLIETDEGLVLVDTGLGLEHMRSPWSRLGASFMLGIRPLLMPQETAIYQIKERGFSPADVRHIVLTHLDTDHAGALADFPRAKVHVFNSEYEAATRPYHNSEMFRYSPALWAHNPDWVRYLPRKETWLGFESVRDLQGLPPDILLVPLPGHTRGHCAVAVETTEGWLLHAGDAYYHDSEKTSRPACPPALEFLQTLMEVDREKRLSNQARLRELNATRPDIKIFCAHDAQEFSDHAGVHQCLKSYEETNTKVTR